MSDEDGQTSPAVTRRTVLGTGGAVAGALLMTGFPFVANAASTVPANDAAGASEPDALVDVTLIINGHPHRLQLDPRTTLLDALREHIAMTGTKKGCDDGQEIATIEGLANGETLHPMQAAFVEHDGFQCGYCTSGQICSAVGMLRESQLGMPSYVTEDLSIAHPTLTDAEIRERMSGNICRCAAYPNIVAAIKQAGGGGER